MSDGETQLLHTIGAVRLFGQEQTLFLMDEPETHLNPNWRTRYHIDFKNTGIDHGRSQALISSHSPFLISSLERSDVFHFEKIDERTMMMNPDDETFGASFEVLIKKYFGLRSAISQTAVESIQLLLEDPNKTKKRNGLGSKKTSGNQSIGFICSRTWGCVMLFPPVAVVQRCRIFSGIYQLLKEVMRSACAGQAINEAAMPAGLWLAAHGNVPTREKMDALSLGFQYDECRKAGRSEFY